MSKGNFLSKVIVKSKNLNRWESNDRICYNTDAEHMWSTAIVCDMLGRIQQDIFGDRIDFLTLLRKAIYHDVIEVETGDILSNIKSVIPEMRACLSRIEKIKFDTEIKPTIPAAYQDELEQYILNPKDDLETIEGRILAVADKVDSLMEAIREVKKGNSNFLHYLVSESEAIINLNVGCGLYFIKYYLKDFEVDLKLFGPNVCEFIDNGNIPIK